MFDLASMPWGKIGIEFEGCLSQNWSMNCVCLCIRQNTHSIMLVLKKSPSLNILYVVNITYFF